MRITNKEIFDAAEEYENASKRKFIGVLHFDFLAGARWMERRIKKPKEKPE